MKYIPYIGILVLLVIILLQNRSCESPKPQITPPQIDTVVIYEQIHDTIPGKPVYISTKIDTSIWMKKKDYAPDTTYSGLLLQYKILGNKHFSTNVFETEFKIGDYGYITITDSIRTNWLISSVITTNLSIPITTITVEKETPSKNQLYIGTIFTGNKINPISGVYIGGILKTKRDRLYGLSIGYDGNVSYAGSLYYKIKLRK